ncbi:GPP34 family phosphoprotein [Streptomyces sp. NBC_00059]|uniref:GOLPH3/VPS74 family protein n=1 Tax=Streptomyces sp. NBC_00059 TaxID=2975635 RepID=UPI002253C041|nr:GPP34 family phosphoprotein [Streptomyces sp. NBC_00059]MCX5417561.1 GPP34 family phosphoprotein [Streptomyces sp. NBC_00059]
MTTAKDLFIITLDPRPEHAVGQGDLSLALAGAELIDLIGAGAVTVDGDRIVPGEPRTPDDALLGDAAAGLTRQPPHERIDDWLWRRGEDLSAAYQDGLEKDGELTRKRSGRSPFGPERVEPADTPGRRRAAERRETGEPVLAALASAVGIDDGRSGEESGFDDEAVATVVAAVHDAVMELEAVRQRRNIENSAFANLWRGP